MTSNPSRVYVCHTLYHVYIAALKVFSGVGAADVVLINTIPDVDALAARLRQERVFGEVAVVRKGESLPSSRSYHLNWLFVKLFSKRATAVLGHIAEYNEVFLFSDYTEVGAYLNAAGCWYHLLEDGCDCYKVTDQYAPHGKARVAKQLLRSVLDVPLGLAWGPCVIDVEVNDASALKTELRFPIIESPRTALAAVPSQPQVESLFRIFDATEMLDMATGDVLILTEPLWELGIVKSKSEAVDFYKQMAECFPGMRCIVKPHPRDDADYASAFGSNYVMAKNIPIELLNYLGEGSPGIAATYSSTSIYSLKICKRCIVFDPANTNSAVEHMAFPPKDPNLW